ncbi:MAG: SMC-Scp complex subunit ScpB [Kiritimatiellae bacterium]|nr:SMC-Scp complex subunit ScpB [Kiritimatiellia bacterium]MBQ2281748.1 SMC-Scp complex subunit ScpB [Kiritimatiellia bacterium]
MLNSSNEEKLPELKQIICALILGSDHPITPQEIHKIVETVEEERRAELEKPVEVSDDELEAVQRIADEAAKEGESGIVNKEEAIAQFAEADASKEIEKRPELKMVSDKVMVCTLSAVKKAIAELQEYFKNMNMGMELVEISGGYRFQTASDCGRWVRKMLNKGKPTRLARPAIETLAIIAYRQPVSRSEIEGIRGVSAGHVIKALMEMQLVRIIGRSDLPGRPFLFGTTNAFLDHFGLKSLKELEGVH